MMRISIAVRRVVANTVEFVLVLLQIFAQQLLQKLQILHFKQGMTMVDPFTPTTKAFTAKQHSPIESASLNNS